MFVIAGLGNPGPRYETTRHNVGFLLLDELARKGNISLKTHKKFQAILGEGVLWGEKVILVKPLTFMNLCGDAVGSVCRYYHVQADRLITITDDLDQEPGQVKMRVGGGHGGHNGLRDIIAKFGSEFLRLKVGIGKAPKEYASDSTAWVLGPLSDEELLALQEPKGIVFTAISERLENIFKQARYV